MQVIESLKPLSLDFNTDLRLMKPGLSPFIKGFTWDITGSQDVGSIHVSASNELLQDVELPAFGNRCIGAFESTLTNELYYFNYNDDGNHGIYVISGSTGVCSKVIVDPALNFSDDPRAYIAPHRVRIRVLFDDQRNIIEVSLIFTDGKVWQKWINVRAAIATKGFDATTYPYFTLRQPHFDRRELLEHAVRPPMVAPVITTIPNQPDDFGKPNRIMDHAFRFATDTVYTDGRPTTLSPWSLPLVVKREEFNSDPDTLPKKARLVIPAGSCMVEKVRLYYRVDNDDWYLYDVIDKYTNSGDNDPEQIGRNYWLRTDPFTGRNYDSVFNTFEYIFSYDRVHSLVSQEDVLQIQNDIPIQSIAMTDVGDSILYGNNLYGFDNFGDKVTGKLQVRVGSTSLENCSVPVRKVKLYAYTSGRYGNSAVAYNEGTGTQTRFGGIRSLNGFNNFIVDVDESKHFKLDFGDRTAYRCFLKGTDYYADGKWYKVNPDHTMTKVEPLNINLQSAKDYIKDAYDNDAYFVCVFEFTVPAGRYVACMSRHNSTQLNYKTASGYVMGIANSASVATPYGITIINDRHEIPVDCTTGNVDTFRQGGADMFYMFSPYFQDDEWRFIEGNVYEEQTNRVPIEMLQFETNHGEVSRKSRNGFTDRNGFFFCYTAGGDADKARVVFHGRIDCTSFTSSLLFETSDVPSSGNGYFPNQVIYARQAYGNRPNFDCTRIHIRGRVLDPGGTVGYSNIAVHLDESAVTYTRVDGTFDLIVHNGPNVNNINQPSVRRSGSIYFNSAGSFTITAVNCSYVPLLQYFEELVTCLPCSDRQYPVVIEQRVKVQSGTQVSIKSDSKVNVSIVGADLAGRVTYCNPVADADIPSFLARGEYSASYLKWFATGNLFLPPEVRWLSFYVSRNTLYSTYLQWVGDSIEFINSKGDIVTDTSNAIFARISIQSFLEYNRVNNFSLIAKYSFVEGDRLRILDDGEGNMFDTATFGSVIDVNILGTNYNAATIATLSDKVSTDPALAEDGKHFIISYDKRLDKLKDKVGFWIEIIRPSKETSQQNYFEVGSFYPVLDGEMRTFLGFNSSGVPLYDDVVDGNLDYWDTYFLNRNLAIGTAGGRFLAHPFESPNIADAWGAGIISGGRENLRFAEARRTWYGDDVIKSDDNINEGLLNGLGRFREKNRTQFKGASWGGITAMHSDRSIILFVCEKDWFTTAFNFNYVRANASGVMIATLDKSLSDPNQKIGDNYGLDTEDTASLVVYDKYLFWHDRRNGAFVVCDFSHATDITEELLASHYRNKSEFMTSWNNIVNPINGARRFDVVCGVDYARGDILVTFRPRRNGSIDPNTFVNTRRERDIRSQETFVYNVSAKRWVRMENFTPEAYGSIRGNETGNRLISFAAGRPYGHDAAGVLNYYGVQTEAVMTCVMNIEPDKVKILQALVVEGECAGLFVDNIQTSDPKSFSYLPANYFKKKEGVRYAEVLRDMNSYPPLSPDEAFRSMLVDGKRMFGNWMSITFVTKTFAQIKNILSKIAGSERSGK